MVYGIIKLINFAHGDIYMIGAFVGYYAINSLGMNFWVTLSLLCLSVCAILGVVIEFLAYRPLRNSTRISALITAIGVSFFMVHHGSIVVGADAFIPQRIAIETYHLGSISVTNVQLLILVVALVLMV